MTVYLNNAIKNEILSFYVNILIRNHHGKFNNKPELAHPVLKIHKNLLLIYSTILDLYIDLIFCDLAKFISFGNHFVDFLGFSLQTFMSSTRTVLLLPFLIYAFNFSCHSALFRTSSRESIQ